jgi:hypothetical protein
MGITFHCVVSGHGEGSGSRSWTCRALIALVCADKSLTTCLQICNKLQFTDE